MKRPTTARLPSTLLEQVACGNCVVLIGPDMLASQTAFAEELAQACEYPTTKCDRSLPPVAHYFEAMMDRQQLISRLRTWVETVKPAPDAVVAALARLPATHFVDLTYGSHLQRALAERQRACTVVMRDHELPYADRRRTLLVKPFGRADQPESVLITEEDLDRFQSPRRSSRPLLLDQLQVWAATQVLLPALGGALGGGLAQGWRGAVVGGCIGHGVGFGEWLGARLEGDTGGAPLASVQRMGEGETTPP